MRKITFTLLFFCLTITTVLAQVVTTNIATPNSNGLSNNQVDDFDVTSDGTILNNSTVGGTAQLGGTTVTANPNITAGSEASLILFQVTSILNTSDLKGAIEVFGTTAGVIIANPYRITCNGCGFINTNKVEIVVGTANLSGTDLTDFSISTNGNSRITVNNSGFADSFLADELNLVARDIRIQSQTKANNTLRVLTGNDTYDHTTNIITSNTTESAKHSIQINVNGSLEADNIELIGTEISSSHGILNAGGDIEADRLKLDFNGLFRNQNDGTNVGSINISGLLEVTNTVSFINNGNITADTLTITTNEFFNNDNGGTQLGKIVVTDIFSLSIPSQTSYTNTGTVSSDSLDLTIGGDFDQDGSSFNNFAFNNSAITTMGNYSYSDPTDPNSRYVIPIDSSLRVFGDANIQVNFFSNDGIVNVDGELDIDADTTVINQNDGTISTDSLVVKASDILNTSRGKVTANNATITLSGASSSFSNSSSRKFDIKNDLDIFTPTFENSGNITVGNILRIARNNANAGITTFDNDYFSGNGTINADTFNLSVAGDFDYIADYLNNGTITDSALNLNVGGNFSYNDSTNNFTWEASDSLTVAGNANIDARTRVYTQKGGTLDVAGALSVSATDIVLQNVSTINVGGTLSVSATNSFTPGSGATISVDTFDFSIPILQNQATFTANYGTINISGGGTRQFYNDRDAEFNINNSLNIITAGAFINYGNISAGDTLTITLTDVDEVFVNHFSIRIGNISTNIFNLSVAGNFDYEDDYLNNGTITTTTALNLNVGGNFSYDDSASDFIWGASDSLTVLGNTDITANSFSNSGNITADALALSVAVDFDYIADFNGAISFNSLDLSVGGNFSNNDASNDFIWDAQNNLTVSGNADITTDNYTQNGAIDVTGALTINVESDFDYVADFNGAIDFNSLNLNVGGNFINNDSANNFTWNANDSLNVSGNADITTDNYTQNGAIDVAGALAISAGGDFTNFIAGSINAAILAITVGEGTIDNDGTITTTSSLTIDTDTIHNSGDITANTSLTINATNNVFSGGSIETSALAIDAGRNFGISGSITTDSLNITAGYTALNTGTIVSGSLDITTDDFFRNLAGGDISVDSLNITAGGKVTNIATITAGTLNIIANNDSTRDDTTDFYVANRGDITVTNLINITAVDNFYNTGDITADTLAITAKDIIFLNTDDNIEAYDGGDIVLSGDSSFIADGGDGVDGGIIVNRGNIDLGVFNLDITANRFINHADATIDADTLNLNVSSFVQNGFIDAIINQ